MCFYVIHRERCYCSSSLCMLVGVLGVAYVIIASMYLVKCAFFSERSNISLRAKVELRRG